MTKIVLRKKGKNPKLYPGLDEDYNDFYRRWEADLDRISYRYAYRFGLWRGVRDVDECRSELNDAFWCAFLNWKPGVGIHFGLYFWVIWSNRLRMRARSLAAQKRQMQVVSLYGDNNELVHDPIDPMSMYEIPLFNIDPSEEEIITLLAQGYRPTELRQVFGRYHFDKVQKEWGFNFLKHDWR